MATWPSSDACVRIKLLVRISAHVLHMLGAWWRVRACLFEFEYTLSPGRVAHEPQVTTPPSLSTLSLDLSGTAACIHSDANIFPSLMSSRDPARLRRPRPRPRRTARLLHGMLGRSRACFATAPTGKTPARERKRDRESTHPTLPG